MSQEFKYQGQKAHHLSIISCDQMCGQWYYMHYWFLAPCVYLCSTSLTKYEALLGGGSALPAPFNILPHSQCSPLTFAFPSFLAIFGAPFSFLFAPCSLKFFPFAPLWFPLLLAPFYNFQLLPAPCCIFFCVPCSHITNFMLPTPFIILGHAPCSLGSQRSVSLVPDYP